MTSPFIVKEHRVPGQHIREYPRATADAQEEVLELAVKEYIPRDGGGEGAVTVLAAHANGFPKVCPPFLPFSSLIYTSPRFLLSSVHWRGGKTCVEVP